MEGGLINPLALIRTGAAKGVTSPPMPTRKANPRPPPASGLIQSLSQGLLPELSAWVEVGGIASSLCLRAFLLQPISI